MTQLLLWHNETVLTLFEHSKKNIPPIAFSRIFYMQLIYQCLLKNILSSVHVEFFMERDFRSRDEMSNYILNMCDETMNNDLEVLLDFM